MMNDKPSIVVAADTADARANLYAALEGDGYSVATCTNDVAVVKYASEHKPDLIILSVPGLERKEDGLVALIGRSSPETRVLPVRTLAQWPYIEMLQRGEGLPFQPRREKDLVEEVERLLAS